MAHLINREALVNHYESMINILEYDAMRSPGKAKMNSAHLYYMYNLLERYTQPEVKKKPTTTVGK